MGTSSMSGSFQPPGPAKRASPMLLSRHRNTSSHVALMSAVVRQLLPTCQCHGRRGRDASIAGVLSWASGDSPLQHPDTPVAGASRRHRRRPLPPPPFPPPRSLIVASTASFSRTSEHAN